MNRRLNPEIFGPQGATPELQESSYSAVATRKLESEMKETRKKVSQLESLLEVVQSQIATMNHNLETRQENISKALNQLELEIREKNLESNRHYKQMGDHFRDQRIKDSQVENMIDRFNSSLIQYENKISTLRKLINDKDMTLMSYRKVIEQIVDEVESLKKKSFLNRSAQL